MKTVWFVRHGEAAHNVLLAEGKKEEAAALRDPRYARPHQHKDGCVLRSMYECVCSKSFVWR